MSNNSIILLSSIPISYVMYNYDMVGIINNTLSSIGFFSLVLMLLTVGWFFTWKYILSKVPIIREVCGLSN